MSVIHAPRSKLVRRGIGKGVRGLIEVPRPLATLKVSIGDTERSRSRLPPARGMVIGRGEDDPTMGECVTGLSAALASASPKEDESDGGGTEGYVSSSARGRVAGPPANEPIDVDEAGVVMLVVPLVVPAGGEKGKGDEPDMDADDGGVVDTLTEAACVGRCICEAVRGIGTRAE